MKRRLLRSLRTRSRNPKSPGALQRESPATKRTRLLDDYELLFYARSFHKAAQALAGSPLVGGKLVSDVDFSPVVNMYRQALELHLKALVLGDGTNFLKTKPDVISVHNTHSVSWLAQFVAQIVTALKWEPEFRCQGVENLADFKSAVEEVNSFDPGSYAFRLPAARSSVPGQPRFSVSDFAGRMNALLELLDSTADALAAEWDLRSGAVPELEPDDSGFGPTIQ